MAIVGFDGTWNDENPGRNQRPSNVRRFLEASETDVIYKRGIGNDEDYGFLMQCLGGAFGVGGKGIVKDALFALGSLAEQGKASVLDVIGFSRGAALALHFANMACLKGVPLPSTRKARRKIVPKPSGKGSRVVTTYTYDWRKIPVRWLGLWDTVPSMGIPDNDINLGYRLDLPEGAGGSHAMALDVASSLFILHRVSGAREVWFMGRHGEVGGSSGDELLANCTLRWMAREAQGYGVPVDLPRIEMSAPRPLVAPPKKDGKSRVRGRRIVCPGDMVHRTVKQENYPNIPWKQVGVVG